MPLALMSFEWLTIFLRIQYVEMVTIISHQKSWFFWLWKCVYVTIVAPVPWKWRCMLFTHNLFLNYPLFLQSCTGSVVTLQWYCHALCKVLKWFDSWNGFNWRTKHQDFVRFVMMWEWWSLCEMAGPRSHLCSVQYVQLHAYIFVYI